MDSNPPNQTTASNIASRLAAGLSPDDPILDHWYHTIDLAPGITTKGHFDLRPVIDKYNFPDLTGKTALDIGAADGFISFELEKRGAAVVALDLPTLGEADWLPRYRKKMSAEALANQEWPRHFHIAHEALGSHVEYRHGSIYDLAPETSGMFDLVFCGSLLVHLQNPLGALVKARSVTRELAVIETPAARELEKPFPNQPVLSFGALASEKEPGEFNTFWRFTTKGLHDMLIYAGFERVEIQPGFSLPPLDHPVVCAHAYV